MDSVGTRPEEPVKLTRSANTSITSTTDLKHEFTTRTSHRP